MKNLIFVFAIMSGTMLVSCGHKTTSNVKNDSTEVLDSDSLVAEVDSASLDSCTAN